MTGRQHIHLKSRSGEILNDRKVQLYPKIAEKLLGELCIDLGICLPPLHHYRFVRTPPKNPEKFTDAVLVAEGLSTHSDLRSEVLRRATKAFQDSLNAGATYE